MFDPTAAASLSMKALAMAAKAVIMVILEV